MTRYILKRILYMIPVFLGVTLLIFSLLYITPGDPALTILGNQATDEQLNDLREEMGLNDSFLVRYKNYMVDFLVHQDLGVSYYTGEAVFKTLIERFPTTMLYNLLAVTIMTLIGVPMGIISAVRQYSWVDTLSRGITILGVSIPSFWLGIMLILQFSIKLKWFPSSGFYGPMYWVLPSLTLGIISASVITRTTRSCMLEVIRQDYIRTARAKGQVERVVVLKHALRNALIPILTVLGNTISFNMGGAVICESVFSIPGVGKMMVDAIKNRDFPLVQGGVLFIAIAASVINLVVDILYAYVDPRIKSMYSRNKKKKSPKTAVQIKGGSNA